LSAAWAIFMTAPYPQKIRTRNVRLIYDHK
jgi:hypothetical protein